MTQGNEDQEITVPVESHPDGKKPTKEDVELAIRNKLDTYPTELFAHGNTVILKVVNFGGKR